MGLARCQRHTGISKVRAGLCFGDRAVEELYSTGLLDASARGMYMLLGGGEQVAARLMAVIGTGFQRERSITLAGEIVWD